MVSYSVKQVAKLAKVSVRTLHLYDEIGLLKPLTRSRAGYRKYGEAEMLRLQQILFYKEMAIPLQQIAGILDQPDFDLLTALKDHKKALNAKAKQIQVLIGTINKTIENLKNNTMKDYKELYEGLSKEEVTTIRAEAMDKWPEETAHAEKELLKIGKSNFKILQKEQQEITHALVTLMHEPPESPAVQFEIARHYQNIRSFWGTQNNADKQVAQYAGLGDLYIADKRYTQINGQPNEQFGLFMSKAMKYYAENSLK